MAHKLCTVTAAADVQDDFKDLALTWPLWDSKTHPQKPKNSGKFRFDYNGSYASERVLIMSGKATLKPVRVQIPLPPRYKGSPTSCHSHPSPTGACVVSASAHLKSSSYCRFTLLCVVLLNVRIRVLRIAHP